MLVSSQVKTFSIFKSLLKTITTVPGRVMSIEPKTQFDQKELAEVVCCVRDAHKPKLFRPGSYDKDVETRLRNLDWSVQDELYKLIRDRTENSSNAFRRREYKLVVLLEVPGGEMTDAGTGPQYNKGWSRMMNKLKRNKAPHVEYRVILRGNEVLSNNAGWGVYDRYAQPWKLADEAELASAREKSGYQEILN